MVKTTPIRIALLILSAAVVLGCGSSDDAGQAAGSAASAPLAAPEVFAWSDQPLEFAPPPPEWTRRAYVFNGKQGVQFMLTRTIGGSITISEFTPEAVQVALNKARRREGTLFDLLHLVQLDPKKYSEPHKFHHLEDIDLIVAGVDAKQVDYLYDTSSGSKYWREIYWVWNNHLYVAAYEGPRENLSVFERVAQTIQFPAG